MSGLLSHGAMLFDIPIPSLVMSLAVFQQHADLSSDFTNETIFAQVLLPVPIETALWSHQQRQQQWR